MVQIKSSPAHTCSSSCRGRPCGIRDTEMATSSRPSRAAAGRCPTVGLSPVRSPPHLPTGPAVWPQGPGWRQGKGCVRQPLSHGRRPGLLAHTQTRAASRGQIAGKDRRCNDPARPPTTSGALARPATRACRPLACRPVVGICLRTAAPGADSDAASPRPLANFGGNAAPGAGPRRSAG